MAVRHLRPPTPPDLYFCPTTGKGMEAESLSQSPSLLPIISRTTFRCQHQSGRTSESPCYAQGLPPLHPRHCMWFSGHFGAQSSE